MSNTRYDNDECLFQQHPLKLLYIATSRYEGDWHSYMHSHQYTEIFYVLSGKGDFKVEELSFPVTHDDIVIINPNVQHTETAVQNNPMEYLVIGVEGGEFLVEGMADSRYCTFSCGIVSSEISRLMRQILKEMEDKRQYHSIVASNLLENLSIQLLRQRLVVVEQRPASRRASRECSKVKHYIDNHFKESITLDMLSELVHINKYYMVHAFKNEMGVSPINYLINRRIEESCHMLLHTGLDISEISQILGFSSPSYFSQSFSRIKHMSPREYRQRAAAEGGELLTNNAL